MIRALLVSLGLMAICYATAQKVQVIDLVSNAAIEGAIVFSEKRATFKKSGIDGQADIRSLLPCDSILVQHAGYESKGIRTKELSENDNIIRLLPLVIQMPTFELMAARESFFESPKQIILLDAKAIEKTQPRTTADLLERSGEVFVQRSQLGGGSPVLRGFEANRILLMIDGVRLNNAIYRSGHLQNAITVDPYLLENTEVIFGPGSLIYGSDALGGVIHFRTKRPKTYEYSRKEFELGFAQRLSTATEERATHFDVTVSGNKLASLTSLTMTRFGKMTMGRNRLHGDDHWGQIPEYVERIEGRDSILTNPDPNVIPNSGYEQYDLAQKLLWQTSDSTTVLFNLQYSTSTDVPRSDQLAAYRNGQLRYAEWNYGPQERLLASVELDILSSNEAFDKGEFIVAFQQIGEDRITRNFNDPERFVRQETVDVFSINGDFIKRLKNKDLYYGLEVTNNVVDSKAHVEDIETGIRDKGPTRYPDGGSRMSTIAGYVNLNARPTKTLKYNLGLRYSQTYADSRYNDTTFYNLPFQTIIFDNGALTGSASLIWNPTEKWDLGLTVSSGFRTPNVDDFGKVFERAGIVVVPTDELSPEYTINGELRIANELLEDKLKLEIAGFYTAIQDAIIQVPSTLNGADSLLYEGEMAQIAVNANQEEAYIYGGSAVLAWQFNDYWSWRTTATKTVGQVRDSGIPLAHIPPFFAKSGLDYSKDRLGFGGYILYNDTKTKSTIVPGRIDNADQGLNGAFPSWYTAHAYLNLKLDAGLGLSLFIDNITNVHYKAFASGLSAPGRNIGFTLRCSI